MDVVTRRLALYQGTGLSRAATYRQPKALAAEAFLSAQGLKPKPFSRSFGTAQAGALIQSLLKERILVYTYAQIRPNSPEMKSFAIPVSRTHAFPAESEVSHSGANMY
jgi:hypothetical protein